jgi:hypothetical protein
MMEDADLHLEISVAWWVKPYIYLVAFFCMLANREPDEAKLERMILRGIKMKVVAE